MFLVTASQQWIAPVAVHHANQLRQMEASERCFNKCLDVIGHYFTFSYPFLPFIVSSDSKLA